MAPCTLEAVLSGALPAGEPIKQDTPPLITTSPKSEPLVADATALISPEHVFGPFAPGISPMERIIPSLATKVDNLNYRLRDTPASPNVNSLRFA